MPTSEEVMITFFGRDDVSSTAGQIDKNVQSMASSISQALSSLNSGFMNLSAGMNGMLSSVTGGKSASEMIFGTSSKAETNKVLLKNMTETEEAAESLYKTVDDVTNTSLTSMQDLIPAMNAFKAATGASDEAMNNITDDMANFGAAVLAQTGSTALAETAMMSLSKGIKGAFASLDQYGVSEDALKRTGLWSGKESDVEGYMAAVTEVIGSTKELMETNEGLNAQLGKSFSRAGKKIGNEFLPIIKNIKKGFIEIDNETGGSLAASILIASEAVDTLSHGFYTISTMANGVRDIKKAFDTVSDAIHGASEATEAFNNGLSIAGAAGAGGQVVQNTSKAEKAVDGATTGLFATDILKNNRKDNKNIEKFGGKKDSSKRLDAIFENFKREKKTFDDIAKENKSVQKVAGESLKGMKSVKFLDDDILLEWEKEGWGLSDKLKNVFSNQKNKITNALSSGKSMLTSIPGKFKSGLTSVGSKFKGIGSSLKSVGGSISNSISSFGTSLKNIKSNGIKGNIKKVDKALYQNMRGLGGIGDKLKETLKAGDKVKDVSKVASVTETVASGGSAISAAAPEMEAAAVGTEATAAASTSLSAAFTSMIVPLLALSAVIMIMIPIVTVIAAEALIFIRLLAEFMESLNFDNVNLEGATEGIKQVAIALLYVGAAMAAMSFASIMTGIAIVTGGFLGITGPLSIAKDALMGAANQLKAFSSVSIDPSVPTNIQSISDSLSSVSSAMMALTSVTITTGFSNFVAWALQFDGIGSALEQAKDEIMQASTKLNEFSGLEPLDDETANKIQNVCDSLASVGDAMSALKSIRDDQNWDSMFQGLMEGLFNIQGVDIQQALDSVKDDIYKASVALKDWNIEEIPEDTGDKIQKVSDALTAIAEAFETLRGFRDDGRWDNMMGGIFKDDTNIAKALSDIKTDLETAATYISTMNIDGVDEDKITQIQNVSDALTKVAEAVTGLTSLPSMEGYDSSTIATAVTNIRTAAEQLNTLSGVVLNDGVDGVLGSINSAITSLRDNLSNLSEGFSTPAASIGSGIVDGVKSGLSPLTPAVQGAVDSATGTAASNGWTGGSRIGSSTTGGFKSALKLADAMKAEMDYVKQAVDAGIENAKQAAANGAADIVQAFKDGYNAGSPGDLSKAMKAEMGYTKDFILASIPYLKKASYTAGQRIVEAFGNPRLPVDLDNFSMERLKSMLLISTPAPTGNNSGRTINVYISSGAIPVSVSSLTPKEAQQVFLSAIESTFI